MSDKRVVCARCFNPTIVTNDEDTKPDAYFFKCETCKRPVGVVKLSKEEIQEHKAPKDGKQEVKK